MTGEDILAIAMAQSALEASCRPEDFLRQENVIALSREAPGARRYLSLPFDCQLISYGNNVVAAVGEKYRATVADYIGRFAPEHCFETPNLHVLDDALRPEGLRVCFMAEYFLPDMARLQAQPCRYPLRLMHPEDFAGLYAPPWRNALCQERKGLDVLGVGAFDGGRLIGLAGCSADCDSMWQIGVDVLPDYRRQGVARAVTSRLALEILARGKAPLYCAAWSNIRSVRNAISSGFRPAWVEMTAKPAALVAQMNGQA